MANVYRVGKGSAHGKIILAGEHAVVHRQPAIALPFSSVQITVCIKSQNRHLGQRTPQVSMQSAYYSGDFFSEHQHLKGIQAIWHAFFKQYSYCEPDVQIKIDSTIPPERGMGSSAALATAFTRSLFDYFDEPLDEATLDKYTSISEKIAHGNPSGIDQQIVKSSQAIYFRKNESPRPFDFSLPGHLVIADTGQIGNTREAVSDVARLLEENPEQTNQWIIHIGKIVDQMMTSIKDQDVEKLGQLMNENHHYLQKLTVSNDLLDKLVKNALASGALGAKLTGGGRGGCMIALADSAQSAEKIASHLKKIGAVSTWLLSLE